jgi:guanylate kinase
MTGSLFIVSAPSGVGKTTIIQSMLPRWPSLRYSVSCTTRSPRPGESHGEDYHFLDRQEFLEGIARGRFLEWAEVHGEFYGTEGQAVVDWLASGDDVLFDIDVQGARQILCVYPTATTIFILPPSMEALRARLSNRGTESEAQLTRRLEAAAHEMAQAAWYEYLIVNDDLNGAISELESVMRALRCRRKHRSHLLRFLLGQTSAPPVSLKAHAGPTRPHRASIPPRKANRNHGFKTRWPPGQAHLDHRFQCRLGGSPIGIHPYLRAGHCSKRCTG